MLLLENLANHAFMDCADMESDGWLMFTPHRHTQYGGHLVFFALGGAKQGGKNKQKSMLQSLVV